MYPGLERVKTAAGKPFIFSSKGSVLSQNEVRFFKLSKPSGYIVFKRNIESVDSLSSLLASIRKVSQTPLYAIDEEGGRVRRLPEDDYSLPSAATMAQWDESEFYQKVFLLGKKLKSIGITVDCAPVVDIRSGVEWIYLLQ